MDSRQIFTRDNVTPLRRSPMVPLVVVGPDFDGAAARRIDFAPVLGAPVLERRAVPAWVEEARRIARGESRELIAAPVVGGGMCDWIDAARAEAEKCIPAGSPALANACGVDANGNPTRGGCATLLREVSLGGSNTGAIAPGASGTITIPIQANFKPLMLQVDPQALVGFAGARATAISYGPTSKLINQFVLLAGFDVTSLTGGYRLGHERFLTAGQTISVTVFNPASSANAFAADSLVINAFGFTDSP
jgi:hypothetical protein